MHTNGESEEMGPEGKCVCPKCGEKQNHRSGTRCQDEKCPQCGAKMLREGSHHHQLFEKKKMEKGQTS
ncbi:MAG: ferredoxin [Calditrichaeota bacterium]|nr:MAG: ferredoxin [Calditrichota bacterium]